MFGGKLPLDLGTTTGVHIDSIPCNKVVSRAYRAAAVVLNLKWITFLLNDPC